MHHPENPFESPKDANEPIGSQREVIWTRALTQWPWILAGCFFVQGLFHLAEGLIRIFTKIAIPQHLYRGSLWVTIGFSVTAVCSSIFLCRYGWILLRRLPSALFWTKLFRVFAVTWILLGLPAAYISYSASVQDKIDFYGLRDEIEQLKADPESNAIDESDEAWKALERGKVDSLKLEILDFFLLSGKLGLALWWLGRRLVVEEMELWKTDSRFTQYAVVEIDDSMD